MSKHTIARRPNEFMIEPADRPLSWVAKLWRAVILRAYMDMYCNDTAEVTPLDREQAKSWFRGAGSNFHRVCDLAECDPVSVRNAAMKLIALDNHSASTPAFGAKAQAARASIPLRPRKPGPKSP